MLKLAFLLVLLLSASLRVRSKGFGVRIQKPCFLTPKRQSLVDVLSSSLQCGRSLSAATPNYRHSFGRGTADASLSTSLRGGAVAAAEIQSSTVGVPPLRLWIGPALVCALSYALYNIFIKKASTSIDPMLGGVLLQIVAALLGTLLLAGKRVSAQSPGSIPTRADGIKWAILAGLAVGVAEILSFMISSMGVQVMQSIPIVIGGSVLFGTILGAVWLKEILTVKGWCGVVLIAAGIALVGMDPGSITGLH
jgi:transporter family protein